jgi:ABC-type bacteriocin/lantibiotic exporter with double-glycine peptidase domain
MVLAFFNKPRRQERLGRLMHTNKAVGTDRRYMIRAATRAGLYCYVNVNASLRELKRLLDDGTPVIVRFVEPSGNEDHYAVACGYAPEKIVLNDPWNGREFVMSERTFVRRWHDKDGSHAGWLMALSTTDFCIGRQYRPRHQ